MLQMHLVAILTPLILLSVVNGNNLEIISFTQSSESVRSGESMTFNCQANASEVEWRIEKRPKFSNGSYYFMSVTYNRSTNPQWDLYLTMWGDDHSGEMVSCYAASSSWTIQHLYFHVAGHPDPPIITINVLDSGISLNVSWAEPDYFSNYPILGYTLEMENTTSGVVDTLVQNTTALSYSLDAGGVVSQCDVLIFSVTAHGALGNAVAQHNGTFPRVPVPVDLTVDLSFTSESDAIFTPSLSIRAQYTDPCLHEEVQYTIEVLVHNQLLSEKISTVLTDFVLEFHIDEGLEVGETYSVVATGQNVAGTESLTQMKPIEPPIIVADNCDKNLPDPLNGRVHVVNTTTSLVAIYTCDDSTVQPEPRTCLANSSWSGVVPFCPSVNCPRDLDNPPYGNVEIIHTPTGLVALYVCDNGLVTNRTCLPDAAWSIPVPTCNGQIGIIVAVAVLAVLLVVVMAVVTIIIIIICVARRRKRISALEHPRRKPPSSIKLASTNPIYEGSGPVYDSPSEPFKSLLTSTPSTPSTPSVSSPRYFNMPPQLPPPRKSSISSPFSPTASTPPLRKSSAPFSSTASSASLRKSSISAPFSPTASTPSSVCQLEEIQASYNKEVPPTDEAYTIMKPAPSRSISRPNKPSPLFLDNSILEAHGEYATVK